MKPTEDRLIIKPVPPETQTKSGLIIPTEAQKVQMWEVVSVGPTEQKIKIEPGMIVVIPESAGTDFEYEGEKLRVIRHASIELYDQRK